MKKKKITMFTIDAKLDSIKIDVNNFTEFSRKIDIRQGKLETEAAVIRGILVSIGSAVAISCFFFVKLWNKVFP